MRQSVSVFFLGLSLCCVALCQSNQLAIVGATVIDGTGKAPMPNATLLIDGNGKITQVASGQAPPAGVTVVDAKGQYIIPGLWDMHLHYRDWFPELLLHYGIVALQDLDNPTEWITAVKDAVAKGKMPGPRMFVCGDAIGVPKVQMEATHHGYYVGSVEEARAVARKDIAQGVDCLKNLSYITLEEAKAVSEEAGRAGIRRAGHAVDNNAIKSADAGIEQLPHMGGIAVASLKDPELIHKFEVAYTANPDNVVVKDPRLRTPLPDARLMMDPTKTEEVLQYLLKKKVVLEPDFITTGGQGAFTLEMLKEWFDQENLLLSDPNLKYVPEDFRGRLAEYRRRGLMLSVAQRTKENQGFLNIGKFLKDYQQNGGMVLAGTDTASWSIPGLSLHQEMQLMVRAGLTPMQTIQAASYNGARYFHKEGLYGSIQPGRYADLVILNADPLADIKNTLTISAVYKEGKLVDRSFHASFMPALPAPYTAMEQGHNLPLPGIVDFSPKIATEGDRSAQVSITGSGFIPASVVTFAGHPVATKWVSPSVLQATIPEDLLRRPGTFPIIVRNPLPVDSNVRYFVVKFN